MRKCLWKLHRQVVCRGWYATTSFLSQKKNKNKPIIFQSQIAASKTLVYEMDKSQKEWKQAQFFCNSSAWNFSEDLFCKRKAREDDDSHHVVKMIGIVYVVLCTSIFVEPQHSQVCQIGVMAIESMTSSSSSAKGLIFCRIYQVNEYVGGGSKMKTRFGVSHSKTIHKWTCKDDMTMMMLRSIVTYIHVWRSTTFFSSAYPRKNFVSIIYYNYSFDHQDKMLACKTHS